jgi:hypothetical protein
MVTLVPPHHDSTTPARKSLGYDFALLGLKAREARVEVIRSAAERTAAKIPDATQDAQRVEMLAELATATYRLLDPRRRSKTIERLQLSLVSEVEPVLATVAKKPLVVAPVQRKLTPVVLAELVEPGSDGAQPQINAKAAKEKVHKVSYSSEGVAGRKLDRQCRLGIIALSVLSTLIASSSLVAWVLFG